MCRARTAALAEPGVCRGVECEGANAIATRCHIKKVGGLDCTMIQHPGVNYSAMALPHNLITFHISKN